MQMQPCQEQHDASQQGHTRNCVVGARQVMGFIPMCVRCAVHKDHVVSIHHNSYMEVARTSQKHAMLLTVAFTSFSTHR